MADRNLRELGVSLDFFFKEEIEAGSFPSASYAVGNSEGILFGAAQGHLVVEPAKIFAKFDTLYDAASLTKPLVTATLILRAYADGRIALDGKVSEYLPELRGTDKENLTFVDLLVHRGGFQAWYPLYTQGTGDEAYLKALLRRPLRYRPGTREIYSCLGFILLHLTLERIYGRPVEELAAEMIFAPLGLTRSCFNPEPSQKYAIAATEWGNANERRMVGQRNLSFAFRKYMIWGEVNDGNAYYMGGVGGNAGLFSTAGEVMAIARAYLTGKGLLPLEVVRLSTRNYTLGLEENRGLGWQLPAPRRGGPTSMLSEGSYGHTGFTGTSVWVDPERDLIMVLLTNRLHPQFKPLNMQAIRRRFHSLVVEQWDRIS